MVKHSQTIHWLLPKNCLSVFDHFWGLALKGLIKYYILCNFVETKQIFTRSLRTTIKTNNQVKISQKLKNLQRRIYELIDHL